jgi:predicted ATPase/class 3 adenylate cyclase
MSAPGSYEQLAAILAADMVGYSRRMAADEHATESALDYAKGVFGQYIQVHGGRVIHMAGDSILGVFETAVGALRAAIEIQEVLEKASEIIPEDRRTQFRVGIHVGDIVVKEDSNIFGDGVNVACRIQALANPGGIWVSDAVRGAVRHRIDAGFNDRGEHRVKNIPTSVRVYSVSPGESNAFVHSPAMPNNYPGNLAAKPPLLIGREEERKKLQALVRMHSPVTMVGTGGVGKTALAMATAHAELEHFKGGAWFVPLSMLRDPGRVPDTIAEALGVTVLKVGSTMDRLVNALDTQSVLIILDGCEHLIAATSSVVEALGASCPNLRFLITSQQALNHLGEHVFELEPLSSPTIADGVEIGHFDAVRLLVDRASAANQKFALTRSNAQAIGEICRRLDGIPLAIELAASRIRSLGVQGVRDRLDQRFLLLTGGRRGSLSRHQTVRSAVAWSLSLLSDAQRDVLLRLSTFSGDFPLGLAQGVAAEDGADEWPFLDEIGELVNKSLLVGDGNEPPRYRLLQTTRAYALGQMSDQERNVASDRHAQAVRRLFDLAEEGCHGELGGLTADAYLERLTPDLNNLRAAFEWATSQGDMETAISLAGSSSLLFRSLGLAGEAFAKFIPLRASAEASQDENGVARYWHGIVDLGDLGLLPSESMLTACDLIISVYAKTRQRRRLYRALYSKGWTLLAAGLIDKALEVRSQMEGIASASDPPWLRAASFNLLAAVLMGQGEFEAATKVLAHQSNQLLKFGGHYLRLISCQEHLCAALNCLGRFDQVIDLATSMLVDSVGRLNAPMGYTLFQLLHAYTTIGCLDEAIAIVVRALPVWRRDGMLPYGSVYLATLFAAMDRFADAARLEGAALAHVRSTNIPLLRVRALSHERLSLMLSSSAYDARELQDCRTEGAHFEERDIAALCARLSGDSSQQGVLFARGGDE